MLKSLRNHEAGSAACGHQLSQPTSGWCGPMQRKINSLMMIKYIDIAIEFVQARQIGLKANTILGT